MKGIVINPGNLFFFSDHLAPLASLLNYDYFLQDSLHTKFVKKYYPNVNILEKPQKKISIQDTFSEYSLILHPVSLNIRDKENFQTFFGGGIKRFIYCHHGYSDKPLNHQKDIYIDMNFAYGENMLDLFKDYGHCQYLKSYILTGNYRYLYYKKHRAYLDKVVDQDVFQKFLEPQRPSILYAPTWNDSHDTTSFFEATENLIETLPKKFNLIIKLHPKLTLYNTNFSTNILKKVKNQKNIITLLNYTPIYPLLNKIDIFIGDNSSIGYDFLTFNRPMFFLNKTIKNPQNKRLLQLFKCGTIIQQDNYKHIFHIIEEALSTDKKDFSSIRKQTYQYTFGKEIDAQTIKNNIIKRVSE